MCKLWREIYALFLACPAASLAIAVPALDRAGATTTVLAIVTGYSTDAAVTAPAHVPRVVPSEPSTLNPM